MDALSVSPAVSDRKHGSATRLLPERQASCLLFAAIAALLSQFGSVLLWSGRYDLHLVWFPGAILLCLALVLRRGLWPSLAAGTLLGVALAAWLLGLSPWRVLLVTVPVPLTMLGLAWAIRALGSSYSILTDLHMAIAFMLLVIVSAVINGVVIHALGVHTSLAGIYLGSASNIALAHALGCILLVPPWLGLVQPTHGAAIHHWFAECLVLTLVLLLVGIAWQAWGNHAALRPMLILIPLPAIIFAFVRLRLLGASLAVLALTLVASLLSEHNHSPFAGLAMPETVIGVQLWALPLAGGLLFLSAIFEQRRAARMALANAQRELQSLAGRLISAQEDERARIARDLHDDVGQRVAGAAILLSTLRRRLESTGMAGLDLLQGQLSELSDDVRNLSHMLHPSALKHVGLAAALESLCARQPDRGPAISLDVDLPPPSLPDHVQLCIYRIVQEALRNVAVHAQARHAMVRVVKRRRQVSIEISDDGRGFMPERAQGHAGLGLVSMQERVRMEGGHFEIASEIDRGTRICIRLQLPSTNPANPG